MSPSPTFIDALRKRYPRATIHIETRGNNIMVLRYTRLGISSGLVLDKPTSIVAIEAWIRRVNLASSPLPM